MIEELIQVGLVVPERVWRSVSLQAKVIEIF
jgi:hypothetical protein